jgi:hypothetical protein
MATRVIQGSANMVSMVPLITAGAPRSGQPVQASGDREPGGIVRVQFAGANP